MHLQQSGIFDTSKKDLLGRQAGRCSASFRKGEKKDLKISFYYILPTIVVLLACRFMWLLFVRVFFWKGYLRIMGPSKQTPLPYVPQLFLYWNRQKGWSRWYSATLKWVVAFARKKPNSHNRQHASYVLWYRQTNIHTYAHRVLFWFLLFLWFWVVFNTQTS